MPSNGEVTKVWRTVPLLSRKVHVAGDVASFSKANTALGWALGDGGGLGVGTRDGVLLPAREVDAVDEEVGEEQLVRSTRLSAARRATIAKLGRWVTTILRHRRCA